MGPAQSQARRILRCRGTADPDESRPCQAGAAHAVYGRAYCSYVCRDCLQAPGIALVRCDRWARTGQCSCRR